MSWSAFNPRPANDTASTHMSTSPWIGDGGVAQRVTEVPLPAAIGRTPQIPIITYSDRLNPPTPHQTDRRIVSCATDEEPRCLSLPLNRIQEQQRLKQIEESASSGYSPNCSFSCDDLSASAPADVGERMGRLCKALSDNPVYASGSPPVPPRDYIPRAQSRPTLQEHRHQKPEIHPIVQDGQKCSNTHYWLLPDKQKTASLDAMDKTTEPQLYVNLITDVQQAKKSGSSKPSGGWKMPTFSSKDAKHQGRSHHVSDSAADSARKSVFYSDAVPLLSDVSSIDSMSINLPIDEPELVAPLFDPSADNNTTSMGEVKEMMEAVRSKVDGVTSDESFTALATHHWNVDLAVEYLKVENLFRLGVASRDRCRRLLEIHDWKVEPAASGLLDLIGIDLSKRKS